MKFVPLKNGLDEKKGTFVSQIACYFQNSL